MSKRYGSAVFGLLLAVLATWEMTARAQSLDNQKAAVVKVTSQVEGLRRTGTGFIVRLDADAAYIVTASHVVEGDSQPQIEFFTRRNATVPAETARIEGGDPRGLALLIVRGKDKLPAGLSALPIAQGSDPSGGEAVTLIGFPQGGGAWAVLRASIVSREGRDLTLDGSIAEGNSGGPVIVDATVVGVITSVGGAGKFGRAVPATLVRLILEGWGVQFANAVAVPPATRREKTTPAATERNSNDAPPAERSLAGSGSVKIAHAACEKLRSGTAFRITLNGEGQGPDGALLQPALFRDAKQLSRPKISCSDWKTCQRQAGEPENTRWSVSTMVLLPAPTEVAISLETQAGGSSQPPYAVARTQLNCLLQ
jgi:hypothetical protein